MSRATTSGPVSESAGLHRQRESCSRISLIGRLRSTRTTSLATVRRRSSRAGTAPGRVSSCSRNTPSGVILALAWRSAEQETAMPTGSDAPWRGSRMTRTSWQKYLPPNCAPMPKSRGHLEDLLLEVVVAERVAELGALGGQGVEVAGGGELRDLERVLGRHAADDDGEVVRRAGRRAERAQLLVQERAEPLGVQQRLRLLVEEGLVGRAAALGHHEELVLRRAARARSTARPARAGWCRCCARPRTTWAPSASSAGSAGRRPRRCRARRLPRRCRR